MERGRSTDAHHHCRPRGHSTPNHWQPSQPSQGKEGHGDSSWPLFVMYSKTAQEEDDRMVARLKQSADATLIFTGLFSAVVAAALTVTFPDLRPNSQDTSAFYLENIFGLLADPNISNAFIRLLCLNLLLSLHRHMLLTVGLTGAIEATIIQQGVHRFITVSRRPWHTPEQRARVRELYSEANQGPYVFWGIGELSLPFYIHSSIFLFLAGGFIYLLNISHVVLFPLIWWCAILIIAYALFTVGTIFKSGLLFCTPLSPLALRIYLGILCAAFRVCSCITPLRGLCNNIKSHYRSLSNRFREGLLEGKSEAVEEAASQGPSKIDANVLESTLNSLNGDDAIVEFFEAIPGFFSSNVVNLLPADLPTRVRDKFKKILHGFLHRAFRSNMAAELVVRRPRVLICLNASRAVLGSDETSEILYGILNGRWHEVLQSVQGGHSLGHWPDEWLSSYLRGIITSIVSQMHEHDNRLAVLLQDQFGLPDHILRDIITHGGDSMSLAILVHVTRHLVASDFPSGSPDILRALPQFDTHHTLPRLQHEFCTLWDEIFREAQKRGAGSTPTLILIEIRHIYIAFHQATDAPTVPSSSAGALRKQIAEKTINSPPFVSSSSPSRNPVPTPSSSIAPTVSPSLLNVAIATQSGHLLDALASSSQSTSLTISHPQAVAVHAVSRLDPRGTDTDTLLHDDTRGLLPGDHARLSERSAPDTTEGSLRPRDREISILFSEVNPVRTAAQQQVTGVLGAHVTSSIRAVSGYDYTRGTSTLIPMEVLPHSDQSTEPAPGIDLVTFPPEDRKSGRN
ncbi:hypothetical protein BJV74DRAFT_953288 [Russula compacta]|nr:hypothetical protein BJV74DRAFT_953288 [Russula compacta]